MIIAARRLLIDGEIIGPGGLVIEDGRIVRVLDGAPDDADVVLADGVLAPGLIDLHNNGGFGIDCATAGTVDFETLCRGLAACGVSSFLPTVITAPIGDLQAAAGRIDAAMQAQAAAGPGAAMLGLHLEGPFLAPERRGAHRADWLIVPDAAALADASKQFGDNASVLAIEAQWLSGEGRYADAIKAWQTAKMLSPGKDTSAIDAEIARLQSKL
ncbi:MAG: hypothetical protein B7X01_04510 [Acidiphilium sp. 21-62-4]|nr:MAG: hypothetical protein B7X01_04510 [Acidiphilium sp. 21-62-4]